MHNVVDSCADSSTWIIDIIRNSALGTMLYVVRYEGIFRTSLYGATRCNTVCKSNCYSYNILYPSIIYKYVSSFIHVLYMQNISCCVYASTCIKSYDVYISRILVKIFMRINSKVVM